MAQDLVPSDAQPLKTSSQRERLMLFAELEAEGRTIPATRARMLTIAPESELRSALCWLMREPSPCPPDRLIAYLRALALTHPMQELSEQEASLKFRIFCEDIGHIPEVTVREACRIWRRDPATTFFPTPGKLLAICKPMMDERAKQRLGAERMLATLDRTELEPEPESNVYGFPGRNGRVVDFSQVMKAMRATSEAQQPPKVEPEQEETGSAGELSDERKAELAALRERLKGKAS